MTSLPPHHGAPAGLLPPQLAPRSRPNHAAAAALPRANVPQGPGEYDGAAKAEERGPRWTIGQRRPPPEEESAAPGVGAYALPETFGREGPRFTFGERTDRPPDGADTGPGPGEYRAPPSAFPKAGGRGVTVPRTGRDDFEEAGADTPGPGVRDPRRTNTPLGARLPPPKSSSFKPVSATSPPLLPFRPQEYRPRAAAVQPRAPAATIGRAGALVAGAQQPETGPGPSDYVPKNLRGVRHPPPATHHPAPTPPPPAALALLLGTADLCLSPLALSAVPPAQGAQWTFPASVPQPPPTAEVPVRTPPASHRRRRRLTPPALPPPPFAQGPGAYAVREPEFGPAPGVTIKGRLPGAAKAEQLPARAPRSPLPSPLAPRRGQRGAESCIRSSCPPPCAGPGGLRGEQGADGAERHDAVPPRPPCGGLGHARARLLFAACLCACPGARCLLIVA